MLKLVMITSLILQLGRGIWFIEPNYAEAYQPIVFAILSGQKIDLTALLPKAFKDDDDDSDPNEIKQHEFQYFVTAKSLNAKSNGSTLDEAPRNSIAVTKLHGVVMKDDFCGAPGTDSLMQWMRDADQHENITGHILHVKSPGGSADATIDMDAGIKALNKPVVTFSDGLMASAAYWIGSAGRHVMASNVLNEIGSIGTYMTIRDWSERYKQMGMKEHNIYATASTQKNIEFIKALEGNYEPMRNNLLNPFNDAFLAAVKRNRFGKKLNEAETLKGQLHITDKALSTGLIDSVGPFSEAVNLVYKLSNSQS